MPPEASAYLRECCTIDPDGDGPKKRTVRPGSEPLWEYLSWLTVLQDKLEICAEAEGL